MNVTVKELVTQNIYETLGGILNLGGSQADAIAERESVRGSQVKDRNLLLLDNGDNFLTDSPQWKDDWTASYTVVAQVTTSDADNNDDPPCQDAELARLVGDVRKALMADWTRGGNAINTVMGSDRPAIPGQFDLPSRLLDFTVHYRTTKDEPFEF